MEKRNIIFTKDKIAQREVIQRKILGESNRSIGRNMGIDNNTIGTFLKSNGIRDKIEKEQERLSNILPKAVRNVKILVEEFPEIDSKDINSRQLSYQATKDLLKGLNVYKDGQVNIKVNNNKQAVILPDVLQILQKSTIYLEGGYTINDIENNSEK